MSDAELLAAVITTFAVITLPLAVRSTRRLFSLWRGDLRRSLLLLAFWVVAAIVTTAGLWIGFLLVRRLVGLAPIEWSPPITAMFVFAVLQVPLILEALVHRVSKRPDQPDNIGGGPA